jgi:hypothetical protein
MKIKNVTNPLFNFRNFGIAVLFASILALVIFTQKGWGEIAQSMCVVYAAATAIFFLVQIYGFVISQTKYCDSIEAPKFAMLEKEEDQWKQKSVN